MASVGIDDTLKTLDQISGSYNDGSIQLKAQPRGLDHKGDLTVVTTSQSIVMVIFRKLKAISRKFTLLRSVNFKISQNFPGILQ